MKLTPKQELFITEYCIDLNATAAYKRAYKVTNDGTARANASKLLANSNIKDIIDARIEQRAKDTGITANYVLTSLKAIADRCMQAEPVLDKEGNPTGEFKFDSSGANKSLELLGKHLKLFTDKVESEVNGKQDIKINFNIPRPKQE